MMQNKDEVARGRSERTLDDDVTTGSDIGQGEHDPNDDTARTLERCRDARETMKPHETADCPGERLSEEYQNEEDGGS